TGCCTGVELGRSSARSAAATASRPSAGQTQVAPAAEPELAGVDDGADSTPVPPALAEPAVSPWLSARGVGGVSESAAAEDSSAVAAGACIPPDRDVEALWLAASELMAEDAAAEEAAAEVAPSGAAACDCPPPALS